MEFEQGGSARAEYGSRLLQTLAASLAAEFGRGFDTSNLRYMRLFYQAFPIRDALRHELSWTHYRTLLRVENEAARSLYMKEAATRGWTPGLWNDRSTRSIMNGSSRVQIELPSQKKRRERSQLCRSHGILYAIP
ncbi:DUF1016 N-terminal domain-containing protein [Terriglobus saanensis]|uniref:DUF1016 N-terminal domain-containing protein n=1 Tax=Terriglobus saanensis TaxID=870903 RepID=UPI001FE0B4C4|nr:DUF1016 N-terminal domain-containing protein [Terriglobus saanensis]